MYNKCNTQNTIKIWSILYICNTSVSHVHSGKTHWKHCICWADLPLGRCVMCIKILILLRIKNYALVKGVSII